MNKNARIFGNLISYYRMYIALVLRGSDQSEERFTPRSMVQMDSSTSLGPPFSLLCRVLAIFFLLLVSFSSAPLFREASIIISTSTPSNTPPPQGGIWGKGGEGGGGMSFLLGLVFKADLHKIAKMAAI